MAVPQDFPQSATTIGRIVFYGLPVAVVLLIALWIAYVWSPLGSPVGSTPPQPVFFSHRFHVQEIGIDCRYCHASVEESSFAGFPSTQTCMNCHQQILVESPLLAPVRESWQSGQPIRWNRVYDLPDFTYFDHSIHLHKGVGCTTCHGAVDEAPLLLSQQQNLTMGWCLNCHRDPAQYLRPREQVFNMDYHPPADQQALGERLVEEYRVQERTSCSVCHW